MYFQIPITLPVLNWIWFSYSGSPLRVVSIRAASALLVFATDA